MKHLFVPSGIALMAKEKGFDEECISFYSNGVLNMSRIESFDWYIVNSEMEKQGLNYVSAPLYQQLIDWFRYKHGIVIWIETAPYAYTFNFRFYIETSDNRQEGNKSKDYYKVYNEALIEGFKLIKTN